MHIKQVTIYSYSAVQQRMTACRVFDEPQILYVSLEEAIGHTSLSLSVTEYPVSIGFALKTLILIELAFS